MNEADRAAQDMKATRGLDTDRLKMLPRNKAVDAAHEVLFPIQSLEPEQMVAAVALLFAVMADRTGTAPHSLWQLGNRIATLQDPTDVHCSNSIQAMRDFIGLRVMAETVSIA